MGFARSRLGWTVEARVRVAGDADDVQSLGAWLGEEAELRGAVRIVGTPITETELGSLPDVVSIALGAGGMGTVLASSLITWLQTRRTVAKITVEAAGRTVTVEIQTLEDVRPLLEEVLHFDDRT